MPNDAGSVGIRVYPDSRGFRAEVENLLRSIQDSFNVHVDADTARAKEKLRNLTDDLTATLNADADTGVANAKLAYASRPRSVPFNATINEGSLASVGAALAVLSGGRALSDLGDSFRNFVSNIDRAAPKLAALATASAAVTSAFGAASASVLSFGNSLAALAPAAAVIPGLFLAAKVSLLAFKSAYKSLGFKDFFENDVAPALNTGLINGIKNVDVGSSMPFLTQKFKNDVWGAAFDLGEGMGVAIAGGLDRLQTPKVSKLFSNLFTDIGKGYLIAGKGTGDLVEGFIKLSSVGTAYIDDLANAFNRGTASFNKWITEGLKSGSIFKSVNAGFDQLKILGSVIGNLFGVLGGLGKAASAGGAGLKGLDDALGGLSAAVNSLNGQQGLQQFFAAARAGAAAMIPGLAAVGSAFQSLLPAFEVGFPAAGAAVSSALILISGALSDSTFQAGFNDLITGAQRAVGALSNVGPQIGQILGVIGQVSGGVLGNIGKVLESAVGLAAPLIQSLGAALLPIVDTLGNGLVQAMTALQPVIGPLSGVITILGAAINSIAQQVISALLPVFQQLAPVVGQVITALQPMLQLLGPAFSTFIAPAINLLAQLAIAILPPLAQALILVLNALQPVYAAFQAFLTNIGPQIQAVFQSLVAAILPAGVAFSGFGRLMQSTFSGVMSALTAFAGAFVNGWAAFWGSVRNVLQSAFSQIGSAFGQHFAQLAAGASNGWATIGGFFRAGGQRIAAIWSQVWNSLRGSFAAAWAAVSGVVRAGISQVVSVVQGFRGNVMSALSGAAGWLFSAGQNIIRGLVRGVQSVAGSVAAAVRNTVSSAVAGVKNFLGIHSPSTVAAGIGMDWGRGLVSGLDRSAGLVDRSFTDLTRSAVDKFIPTFSDGSQPFSGAPAQSAGNVIQNNYISGVDPDQLMARLSRGLRSAMAAGV